MNRLFDREKIEMSGIKIRIKIRIKIAMRRDTRKK
jgi:hypothetical protein